jgi:hypothetical protein
MRRLQHHHPRVGEYRNRAYSGDSQVAAVSFRMLYSVALRSRAITAPTEGYLAVGTQPGNSVRNICRLAKERWKIIPNSAIEPGPARWRHNCGEITSEKPAVFVHHLNMEPRPREEKNRLRAGRITDYWPNERQVVRGRSVVASVSDLCRSAKPGLPTRSAKSDHHHIAVPRI